MTQPTARTQPTRPNLRARASGELPNDSAIRDLAETLRPLLEIPYVRRTRRNHALEHATIHVLSSRVSGLQMAGRSDDSGFTLLGDAPTEQIELAAITALGRLQAGERDLALHPNCGTNLVATASLGTLAAVVGLAFARPKDVFNRLPLVMVGMMFAFLFGQPLGISLQRHITTDGKPGDLEVIGVEKSTWRAPFSDGAITVHRVKTRGG